MVHIDNNGNITCDCSWGTYCTADEGSFCIDCPILKVIKHKKKDKK